MPQGLSNDPFFGRYSIQVGISVVPASDGGFGFGPFGVGPYGADGFERRPFPALREIAGLIEGEEWFQGGHTYTVSDDVADRLVASGFEVVADA